MNDRPVMPPAMHRIPVGAAQETLAAVEATRQRYVAAIDSTLDGYAAVGRTGVFLEVNDAMCSLTGYGRDELLRLTLTDVQAGMSPESFASCFASVTSDGRARFECLWKRRDGAPIDVEVVATSYRRDGVEMFVFVHDITERKRTEAQLRRHVQEAERARGALLSVLEDQREAQDRLRESEERFRGMLEQNIAAIFMVEDGRLTFANRRAGEILGRAPGELMGHGMLDLVVPDDRAKIEGAFDRLLSGRQKAIEETFGALKGDGTVADIGAHAVVATLRGKRAVLGIAQDIGERRRAQEEIDRYIARLERTVLGTLEAVSLMVELRDPYTSGHEKRVGDLAAAIGREMGLGEDVVKGLRLTGYVHDIGKISAPAEILSKPGVLTRMELELIKGHAQSGYDVLKRVDFPWPVAEVILQHHERLDGSGYPRGLRGEAILLEARIISVADVVEAMANHRPYRAGLGLEAALAEISSGSGRLYDPRVCAACLALFRDRGFELTA
jgi:PAS domain S-box-containing protein